MLCKLHRYIILNQKMQVSLLFQTSKIHLIQFVNFHHKHFN